MALNNISINDLLNDYSSVTTSFLDKLKVELTSGRIKNSEYADIVKQFLEKLLVDTISLYQTDLNAELQKQQLSEQIRQFNEELALKQSQFNEQIREFDLDYALREKVTNADIAYKEAQTQLVLKQIELAEKDLELKEKDLELKDKEIAIKEQQLLNEQKQNELLEKQIESFDNKVLLEVLKIQVNGWAMYASSIGIDEDSMLEILNGANTAEVYDKLKEKLGM